MKKIIILLKSFCILTLFFSAKAMFAETLPASQPEVPAEASAVNGDITDSDPINEGEDSGQPPEETEIPQIRDSFPTFNKAMFTFNDKAFHYFFKPIYTGYNSMIPEEARVSVRDMYTNLKMPIRFFNCLFQGKYEGAGTEMLRFVINSTVGVGGFWDPARSLFHIKKEDRDFGQTLGKYNTKPGTYIVWPIIGPSNVRDTFGYVGDTLLNPLSWVSYFFFTPVEGIGNHLYESVNDASIDTGSTYESITKPAIDPYIAIQDAYTQNRNKKMKE